jgi:hypothetical protein
MLSDLRRAYPIMRHTVAAALFITKSAWTKHGTGLRINSVLELKALPRDTEVNLVAQRRHGTARWISISRGKNCLDVHLAGITSFNTFPFVRKW